MSKAVYVVGGGVFGQVIAAKLRTEGHQVTVFDRREKEAGSPPSGGHLKPSWLTAIPSKELTKSLETLDSLYGIQKLDCEFGLPPLTKHMELLRVDIGQVLSGTTHDANVTAVGDGWLDAEIGTGISSSVLRYQGTIIVAAGIWCTELLPQFKYHLTGKKGISWVFHGGEPVSNLIRPWAPYKQIVRTYHGPGKTWIGDGSAIIPKNWDEQRERNIFDRVIDYAPPNNTELVKQRGIRPYMTNGCQQVASRLWLATGGAKSGMALAGCYANKLAEVLA